MDARMQDAQTTWINISNRQPAGKGGKKKKNPGMGSPPEKGRFYHRKCRSRFCQRIKTWNCLTVRAVTVEHNPPVALLYISSLHSAQLHLRSSSSFPPPPPPRPVDRRSFWFCAETDGADLLVLLRVYVLESLSCLFLLCIFFSFTPNPSPKKLNWHLTLRWKLIIVVVAAIIAAGCVLQCQWPSCWCLTCLPYYLTQPTYL
jgi:hypothetical protein